MRSLYCEFGKYCAALGLLFTVFAGPARCQQTGATLVGAVTDATGAVLPKVAIRASNLATNVVRESVADESGNYSIPFLPAGDYVVTATLGGFREARVERVTLQVLQTARVDFQMQPGSVNERVEVSATGALLQTENAAVGTVIDSSKIVDLPLNGRNFIQLAQLIPGVQPGTPGSITVRRGRGSVGPASQRSMRAAPIRSFRAPSPATNLSAT